MEEELSNYNLVIRIPIKATDDPQARYAAKLLLQRLKVEDIHLSNITIKLQELRENESPRGIPLQGLPVIPCLTKT